MLAGILNKLGKIGVIAGFLIGNAVLTYVSNGNVLPIITLREILIASLGLLFIPKSIDIDIEDLIGKTKLLPVTGGVLEGETIDKLNSMSETIEEMAKSYHAAAATVLEDDEMIIFKKELFNNIEELENNILYDDIIDEDEGIIEDIYRKLQEKEEIDNKDLLEIFEDHNNFIIGADDESENEDVKKDIRQMVTNINSTYRIMKLDNIVKHKVMENKKILSSQLNGVSKAISSLAENIEETEKQKVIENYTLEIGMANATKNNSEVSGDSNIKLKLHDGKYMLAISDGMGSR